MNSYHKNIKRCHILVCILCLLSGIILTVKIQAQKEELQRIAQEKNQQAQEAAKAVTKLQEENRKLSEETAHMEEDMQSFIQAYEKNRQEIEGVEAEYTQQQKAYDTKIYLDEIVAQLDRENGTKIGIERYFKIEKKELEEILEKTDCSEYLMAEFPDASYWEDLLPVGDKIWVQYDTNYSQNMRPVGLVVENPLVNLGYKDARAGMYLFDIQKMYPDSQVEEARLEWRNIRYLRYKDDAFVYYYVAISEYGDAAILYITPAMVSDTVQEKETQKEQAPDNSEITERTQYVVSGEYGEQLKEQEKQLRDRKEELQLLQLKNNLLDLVEKKGNEDEDSYIIYEKYFRMKQGEMLRIEDSDDLSVCGMWGHLNSHFGGVTFGTVEDILIQYGNDSMSEPREYELPRALIIFNKNENRGPMEALTGMNFAQIQEALHETEIQEGFMYFEDGTVYYIQYEDARYAYTFVSDYEDGRGSWLVIDKKMLRTETE